MGYIKAFSIKNQWINMSLYFINFMYKTKKNTNNNKVCNWITKKNRLEDNQNPIGGFELNNKWLANGDNIKTDFIEVDKTDFVKIFETEQLGIRIDKQNLNGIYKRNSNLNSDSNTNITNQERENSFPNSNVWNDNNLIYFLKGTNINDITLYLKNSNII